MAKMKPADYWELRCTMEELTNAELNKSREILAIKVMEKDIELMQLRLKNRKMNLGMLTHKVTEAKDEYEQHREKLSKKLKIKLEDVSIDPVTLEIHSLK